MRSMKSCERRSSFVAPPFPIMLTPMAAAAHSRIGIGSTAAKISRASPAAHRYGRLWWQDGARITARSASAKNVSSDRPWKAHPRRNASAGHHSRVRFGPKGRGGRPPPGRSSLRGGERSLSTTRALITLLPTASELWAALFVRSALGLVVTPVPGSLKWRTRSISFAPLERPLFPFIPRSSAAFKGASFRSICASHLRAAETEAAVYHRVRAHP